MTLKEAQNKLIQYNLSYEELCSLANILHVVYLEGELDGLKAAQKINHEVNQKYE